MQLYAIRKVQGNHVGLKLNVTHYLEVYADNINLLGYNRYHKEKPLRYLPGICQERQAKILALTS
jgi:hypothetical protein